MGSRRARLALAAALALLSSCDGNDAPDDVVRHPRAEEAARLATAEEALANAVTATLDPHTMNDAEIRTTIGTGPRCVFRYTSAGKPVLAVAPQSEGQPLSGVVKLNGHLVRLEASADQPASGTPGRLRLAAGPIRFSVVPLEAADSGDRTRRREADMVFEVGEELRVGYGGYLGCTAPASG